MEDLAQGSEKSDGAMVDNVEEPKQPRTSHDEIDDGADSEMNAYAELKPFGERLRMIILLSLLCWAVLIAIAVLAIG